MIDYITKNALHFIINSDHSKEKQCDNLILACLYLNIVCQIIYDKYLKT